MDHDDKIAKIAAINGKIAAVRKTIIAAGATAELVKEESTLRRKLARLKNK